MGLFSFLKNAGTRMANKRNKPAPPPPPPTEDNSDFLRDVEERNKELELMRHIAGMGIPVQNLNIDIEEDKLTVYGQAETQADKEKVILTLGNVEGIAYVDDRITVTNPEPEADFYEVQSGDSLSKIAKKFYGDGRKYQVIFKANQPMLKDPNKIFPGQVLRIPKL